MLDISYLSGCSDTVPGKGVGGRKDLVLGLVMVTVTGAGGSWSRGIHSEDQRKMDAGVSSSAPFYLVCSPQYGDSSYLS